MALGRGDAEHDRDGQGEQGQLARAGFQGLAERPAGRRAPGRGTATVTNTAITISPARATAPSVQAAIAAGVMAAGQNRRPQAGRSRGPDLAAIRPRGVPAARGRVPGVTAPSGIVTAG